MNIAHITTWMCKLWTMITNACIGSKALSNLGWFIVHVPEYLSEGTQNKYTRTCANAIFNVTRVCQWFIPMDHMANAQYIVESRHTYLESQISSETYPPVVATEHIVRKVEAVMFIGTHSYHGLQLVRPWTWGSDSNEAASTPVIASRSFLAFRSRC